MNSLGRA